MKAGFYRRREDSERVQRYLCRVCSRRFAACVHSDTYRQKKRRINALIRSLLVSKVTMRRIAKVVRVNRKTVANRLRFWAGRAERYFDALEVGLLDHVMFDELQTSVHTKCKPVAIPMAVDAKTRRILALDVASMPAQHPLAELALKKYGPRADDRPEAIAKVLRCIAPMLKEGAQVTSDSAPRYPEPIRKILPHVQHVTVRSRRGCVSGQGELKKTGFDPLFALNHTAAMVRDGVSRLVRRTWANSKDPDRLRDHLMVYAHYHNTMLVQPRRCQKAVH